MLFRSDHILTGVGNINSLARWTSTGSIADTKDVTYDDSLFKFYIGPLSDLIPEGTGGSSTVCIGNGATATGTNTVSIGNGTSATGTSRDVAIGMAASASGGTSIALGYSANSSGPSSVALGAAATASLNDAIALGPGASAPQAFSIALGSGATAFSEQQMVVGGSTTPTTIGSYSGHTLLVKAAEIISAGDLITITIVPPTSGGIPNLRATKTQAGIPARIGGGGIALVGATTGAWTEIMTNGVAQVKVAGSRAISQGDIIVASTVAGQGDTGPASSTSFGDSLQLISIIGDYTLGTTLIWAKIG